MMLYERLITAHKGFGDPPRAFNKFHELQTGEPLVLDHDNQLLHSRPTLPASCLETPQPVTTQRGCSLAVAWRRRRPIGHTAPGNNMHAAGSPLSAGRQVRAEGCGRCDGTICGSTIRR